HPFLLISVDVCASSPRHSLFEDHLFSSPPSRRPNRIWRWRGTGRVCPCGCSRFSPAGGPCGRSLNWSMML
ncbi:unnamed protein product, partial [Musa banksii]